ncbi:unnamed protein product [Miscanthus lutarioriparius]|uniref:Amino acid transporter transmembrane domain-containing protein n=1 Tax=Miscanthus lutarioriparius TaxID=422564 RepID=A0A811SQX7_9POAL|nr:unnamed protein product [Miscanthus lutarioriparius]
MAAAGGGCQQAGAGEHARAQWCRRGSSSRRRRRGKVAAFNLAEAGFGDQAELLDDDGRERRTGTLVTASAHIITAVIGSGVLSLAWAISQLGWVIGPVVLLAFSAITWFCSSLLADCYRAPDPVHGKRNYTYGQAVRAYLGRSSVPTASTARGHGADCEASNTTNMIIFAGIQILLSQLPNFHKLWWLSIVAAVMSLAYSSIGLGLSIAKIAGGVHVKTSLTGAAVGVDVTASEKIWKTFQSLGDIAFAYSYSNVLIEIQDTLRSSPPENVVMKKASFIGVSTTTTFYMLCGVLGYAAFGNDAPGNFLTGFGFYDPFWLIDVGNVCIAVHLIGAYQVFCQPIYQFVEAWARSRWPDAAFLNAEHTVAGGRFSGQPVPPRVAHRLRRCHRARRHGVPLLQRLPRAHWRCLLLAAHRLLPHPDVHGAGQDAPILAGVDVDERAQLRLPLRLAVAAAGSVQGSSRPQGLQALQGLLNKDCMPLESGRRHDT